MDNKQCAEQCFLKILGHCNTINVNLEKVKTYNDFVDDLTLLDSNLFHLQQIGEIVQSVPLSMKTEYEYINFSGIGSFKTLGIPNYSDAFSPFLDDVLTVLKNDIPDLEDSLVNILTGNYFRLDVKDVQNFQQKYTNTRCFDFDLVYDRFQKKEKDDGMEM